MMIKSLLQKSMLAAMVIAAAACSKNDDNNGNPIDPDASAVYALGIGVTGTDNVNTNYLVPATDLSSGTISPIGTGLTLIGYRDYSGANGNTVFALGGLGEVNVNAAKLGADQKLAISGSSVFPRALNDLKQIDEAQMLAIEIPKKADGDQMSFYLVDIATQRITKTVTNPTADLILGGDDPIYSGSAIAGNKLFLSYLHFALDYSTNHVTKNYIAVYSYPELKFEKIITDERTGPTGAWETKNGLFTVENGDVYAMSSSNISNGYSQSLKPGGYLKIKKGETSFDPTYFFNTDLLGGKISHQKYLGNGLVLAAISTIPTQTLADRWGDKNLKVSIIDLNSNSIKDVTGIPVHNGVGGRSFPVLADNGSVFYPVSTAEGTFIYKINVAAGTATKGAAVLGTFVGGIFKVK